MTHREKTVFVGDFEGVSWEIQKYPAFSHMNREWCWTFYLNLSIDRIPKENDPESYWLTPRREGRRIHYDYYGHGVLSSIEWHGGITWYSKECGFDGEVKIIKVGCDYQHAFDDEHGEYDFQEVLYDVKEAIKSFRIMVPGYRYYCRYDGGLHAPCSISLKEDGTYNCQCSETNVTSEKYWEKVEAKS